VSTVAQSPRLELSVTLSNTIKEQGESSYIQTGNNSAVEQNTARKKQTSIIGVNSFE
jgi:hypothetical protein